MVKWVPSRCFIGPSLRTMRVSPSFLKTIAPLMTKTAGTWRSINLAPNGIAFGRSLHTRNSSYTTKIPKRTHYGMKPRVRRAWPFARATPMVCAWLGSFPMLGERIVTTMFGPAPMSRVMAASVSVNGSWLTQPCTLYLVLDPPNITSL